MLNTIQIVISVVLVVCILLQQKGEGLSATFGGSGGSFHTRRGVEKGLYVATVILGVLFLGTALASIIWRG